MPLKVFERTDNWNDARPYSLLGFYWPEQRFPQQHGSDQGSQKIIKLKNKDAAVISELAEQVSDFVCSGIAVAVVPGHDPKSQDSGMRRLAKIVASDFQRLDATDAIVRTQFTNPRHQGGDRSEATLRASLAVQNPQLVRAKTVLLLDDITTSGNSLKVCRELLLEHGAERVKLLALGRTWQPDA